MQVVCGASVRERWCQRSRDAIKAIKAKVEAVGTGAGSTGGLCGSGRFRSIERGQGMM